MALFRSDILNQEFFKKAVQSAERTSSVEILELTIGDSKTGLQVSIVYCLSDLFSIDQMFPGDSSSSHHSRGPGPEAGPLLVS